MLKAILFNTFGAAAFKALASGAASALTTTGAMAVGACDLESLGQQIGGVAGAYLVGHLAAWLPANKPMKGLH